MDRKTIQEFGALTVVVIILCIILTTIPFYKQQSETFVNNVLTGLEKLVLLNNGEINPSKNPDRPRADIIVFKSNIYEIKSLKNTTIKYELQNSISESNVITLYDANKKKIDNPKAENHGTYIDLVFTELPENDVSYFVTQKEIGKTESKMVEIITKIDYTALEWKTAKDKIIEIAKTITKAPQIETYYSTHTKKGDSIDSTANFSTAYAILISDYVRNELSYNIGDSSWKIVRNNTGTSTPEFHVYIAEENIENKLPGETIKIYRYDMKTETLMYGNCEITSRTMSGKTYNIIDSSTFNTHTEFSVGSALELSNLVDMVNAGYNNIDISLTNDIDMSGFNWTPLGSKPTLTYGGTFNGDGHSVINVEIQNATTEVSGFFGYVNNATIKDLIVKTTITTNQKHNGGLIGMVTKGSGKTIIQDCVVETYIDKTDGGDITGGGIVGTTDDSAILIIDNCTVSGSIGTSGKDGKITPAYGVGGMVGNMRTKSNVTISNSTTTINFFNMLEAFKTDSTIARQTNLDAPLTITNCFYKNDLTIKQGTKLP